MDETKPPLTPSRHVPLSRLPVPKVGVQSRVNMYSVSARPSPVNAIRRTSPRNHTNLYPLKPSGESVLGRPYRRRDSMPPPSQQDAKASPVDADMSTIRKRLSLTD